MVPVLVAACVIALVFLAGAVYYRYRFKDAQADLKAAQASTEVLRKTVRSERQARKEAETSRNQALRESWRSRVEDARKVETHEEADAALAAAAERLRRH
jgi:hypothetical protein